MNRKWLFLCCLLLLAGLLAGCQCSHEWTEATCLEPRTCVKCALTEGDPLQHSWQDATCTQPMICSLCGTREGTPLAHDYRRSNGYMRCCLCDRVDETAEILPPLAFPSESMTEEEKQAFVDLQGQNDLRNNARFRYQDGLYYGQYWDDTGGSIFIRTDIISETAVFLDQGWAKNIFLAEGNIYYENIQPGNQECGIYRINMSDGAYISRDKISDSYGSMQLKGSYIYYSDFSGQFIQIEGDEDPQGLYRCDLDGKNVTKILDKPVQEFYVFETGILYQDILDGSSIHLCYPDGSGDVKLNDQKSTSAIFDGEYIYYLSNLDNRGKESQQYTCWKMRPDGSENQQVSFMKIFNAFLIHEGNIYFCNASGKSQLYRMPLDGGKAVALTRDTGVYYVQILNGLLKYTRFQGEYILGNYICDLDGKNLREFIPYIQ